MPHRIRREFLRLAGLLILACSLPATRVDAGIGVVVQLRNGDRITGELLAQETNQIIIATSWSPVLTLPLSAVGGLLTATGEVVIAVAPPPPPEPPRPVAAKARPAPPTARLQTSINLGADFLSGAKDRQLYFGRVKTSYEHPYPSDPKKLFRAVADYTADYGETDDVLSANRMTGTFKADFDFGRHAYCYGEAGGGYDEIRKIDEHLEAGPGLGYHWIRTTPFVLNIEGGLNYQSQLRSAGGNVDSLYVRAAENLTWKLADRIKLTESFEFFLNTEDAGMYRLRLDSTLSFSLIRNLSLNLTLRDYYDTDPAPEVAQNEFQFRSSLGITF
jgi:putative salt-induced outer membrane protein